MFSIRVINSARFLRMPVSSQALYFHLGIHADDDGIVEAYPIIKTVGCSEDDLKILVAKGFVQVLNEDLIAYITDWNEHNKIRPDRKIDSIYKNLLLQLNPDIQLIEKRPRADTRTTNGQPMDNQRTTNGQPMDGIGKDRLGKDSIGQDSVGKERGAGETRTTRKTKTEMNLDLLNDIPDIPDAVHQILVEWLTYKGQKKQGYTSQGLKALVKRMINNVNQYGLSAVRDVVENSMGNEYQGIVWDRLKNAEPRKDDNTFLQMLKELENDESGDNQGFGNAESGIPTVLPWLEQG